MAALVSLWSGIVGAGLRQRREARRYRMEAGVSFRAGGVQSVTCGFPRGSRQAFSVETRKRSRERALLSDASGAREDGRTTSGLGIAGTPPWTRRNVASVGKKSTHRARIPLRNESSAGQLAP